jgi:Metallo-beta-lactamase superfamily
VIGLNRRHILTGAVAATAAAASSPLAATPAHAAAPLTGKQAPSFYRLKVGEFEVTVVSDGARAIPLPATFVRNVSNEQVLAAAEAAYMPKGSIVAPFNPMVVNTGAKLVLIDTGYGPGLGPTVGLLPSTLAAAGVDPKSIDIVLISHMHGEHADRPRFPSKWRFSDRGVTPGVTEALRRPEDVAGSFLSGGGISDARGRSGASAGSAGAQVFLRRPGKNRGSCCGRRYRYAAGA